MIQTPSVAESPEQLNRQRLQQKAPLKVSPCGKYWFDDNAANRVVYFFKNELRLIEGAWAGKNFSLTWWQERDLRELFGWKRFSDNTRRYRKYFLGIPRKNGKSTFCAGIALYLLFCEPEYGAQIYSAAGDEEQAAIIFNMAKTMISASKEMDKRCQKQRRKILLPQTNSFYRAISAQAFTKHGMSASGILFDELHVQKTRELFDVLDTSTGARRQPLTIEITTAGSDIPSLCWEEWEHALRVREGVVQDESLYVSIFAADKGDDWKDPEVWAKANPGLGVAPTLDYMERKCQQAINTPSFLNTFKRLHLNIWTESETAWIHSDAWSVCGMDVDMEKLKGQRCYGAVDLSTKHDLTAFVLIFRYEGRWLLVPKFFIPGDGIYERSKRDKVPYDLWRDQGYLIATPGPVVDYDRVFSEIMLAKKLYDLKEVVFDAHGARELIERLLKEGVNIGKFKQSKMDYSEPTKDFEGKVLQRIIAHDRNPILTWNVACTTVEYDANANCRPKKADILKSSKRIDGVIASIMALARAVSEPEPKPNPYEHRGFLII